MSLIGGHRSPVFRPVAEMVGDGAEIVGDERQSGGWGNGPEILAGAPELDGVRPLASECRWVDGLIFCIIEIRKILICDKLQSSSDQIDMVRRWLHTWVEGRRGQEKTRREAGSVEVEDASLVAFIPDLPKR